MNLNRWSKMDVKEAKRPFSWRSLNEIAVHLYSILGVTSVDGMLSKDKHDGVSGYMVAVTKELKILLESQAHELLKSKYDDIAEQISGFEWMAHVHEIFAVRLMNMDELISWDNIDR